MLSDPFFEERQATDIYLVTDYQTVYKRRSSIFVSTERWKTHILIPRGQWQTNSSRAVNKRDARLTPPPDKQTNAQTKVEKIFTSRSQQTELTVAANKMTFWNRYFYFFSSREQYLTQCSPFRSKFVSPFKNRRLQDTLTTPDCVLIRTQKPICFCSVKT